MVSPAARPCGSPGWTLNFSMRDQVQVMSLQGKRLRAFQDRWCTPDGRLLENTDCSVLFKDCRGLLLFRTDEWHSKLQTQASEGALHHLDITVIQYEVRLNGEMLFCDSLLLLYTSTSSCCLLFGFFNRASSDGMVQVKRTISSFVHEKVGELRSYCTL